MHRVAGALVLALALAGCGGSGGDGSSGGNSGSAPTAAATSTPTVAPALSRPEAAQRYLEVVRPYNEALEELEDAINTAAPLADQQDLAARTADALAQEVDDLGAVTWPEDVAPHIEALVAESEQALPHWRRAAEAASLEDLVEAVRAALEYGGTEAAAAVREPLELDEYDERDY